MSHFLIQMFEGNSSEAVCVMQAHIKDDFPPITFKCWGTAVNADNGQWLSDSTDSQTEGSAFNRQWFLDYSAVNPQRAI